MNAVTAVYSEAKKQSDEASASTNVMARTSVTARMLELYARIALAAGFLSSVADRFGLWGPPESAHAAWGNWGNFVKYTALLNFFVPRVLAPALAVGATIAESGLALLLLIGWRKREVAVLAAGLLALFALEMTIALGVKAPLDYSVFAASGGAAMLFLYTQQQRVAR